MFLAPIPNYIVALLLIIFFAYILPIFPVGGGYTIGAPIGFTWVFIKDVLSHAFLPALSIIVLGVAGTHQIMRLIVQGVNEEDYVRYAQIGAVKEGTVFSRYVMRNATLPQITRFALCFSTLFSGALITEVVFAYPGIGFLSYQAIMASHYNMLMGITTISIVVLTTSTLIMDLLNPLFDPRIRLTLTEILPNEDTQSALHGHAVQYRRGRDGYIDRAGPALVFFALRPQHMAPGAPRPAAFG